MTMIKRDTQRLFDLVRYCRAELLKEGLITEDEYTELLSERGSVDRLQKYDRMQKRIKELESEITTMKTEVSESMSGVVKRFEDMSPRGFLQLTRQPDGDVQIHVSGIDTRDRTTFAMIEFCLSGGQSMHTLKALWNLMDAMEKDNEVMEQHRD